ncbi:P-loop containing nucleoside triphosphate hydrolase protein [Cyathus striatus]|nr:P-loop containing nucleoside triphosphate hydrolase protein [Cyathus striatus]
MAIRRPASSRARIYSNANPMPPPQIPRSRSAMSRSASSSKSTEDTHVTSTNHRRKPSDDPETNIQVVIRCRRRSEREVQDNSPIIVSSNGAKSKEVSIETSAPISSLGIVTLPPIRTYPFDLVFGPEADQALVYNEVVHPMLQEVVMGYNCTLFAYGQTGTGKTHTMQGDLTVTPMGNPSNSAGMIPRVLFRLFHHMESSNADYSIKISFIELYNEELRDLLAEELSPPSGSSQPMGLASKDKNPDSGLKIFDDANKRGVFIQGLEEISVKDSKDALALLTKGSLRRQIAATKFNDHSSRSHSVFSITVHIKESSAAGEDLLKIGKLNLVDLAGSENIGRSGAENKRAREAGMINQSLLTLGRVINALVDKAQHVPYRESKLTRLLQDSLGGRTKTCIIATISPARSNLEETLSTLDYALRAKSIRNKPELNQRMTRNSLLKEYVAEIERLKADLLATREKNGIVFSEETWNQITVEKELKQSELEETKKQVEIVESQLRSVREEFEQSIALFMKTDGELKQTQEKLKETKNVLAEKEVELKDTQKVLEEEVVVRKAHQETEVVLDSVASGLKDVAKESLQHVTGLFEKLDRKSRVLDSNAITVSNNQKVISQSMQALSDELTEFRLHVMQSLSRLTSKTSQFTDIELQKVAVQQERVRRQLESLKDTAASIQMQDDAEGEALAVIHNLVKDGLLSFKTEFTSWAGVNNKSCARISSQIKAANDQEIACLEQAFTQLSVLLDNIVKEIRDYMEMERRSLHDAKLEADDALTREIHHLRAQNEMLLQMLVKEKTKTDKAKEQLVEQISTLLGDFVQRRDAGLEAAIDAVQLKNKEAETMLHAFSTSHSEKLSTIEIEGNSAYSLLHQRSGEGKRAREGAIKSLHKARTTFSNELDKVDSTLSTAMNAHSAWVQNQVDELQNFSSDAFTVSHRAKRARIESTSSVWKSIEANCFSTESDLDTTSKNIDSHAKHISLETEDMSGTVEVYSKTASKHLDSVQRAAHVLSTDGMIMDLPTGSTPRKREWKYIDSWKLTGSREDVLNTREAHDAPELSQTSQSINEDECAPVERQEIKISPPPLSEPIPICPEPQQDSDMKSEAKLDIHTIGTLVDSRRRNVLPVRSSRRNR